MKVKTMDEVANDLSLRLTEYINSCDAAALADLGTICFGETDEDVKQLAELIEKEGEK